ncbi:class I SAM-dependent methyltransferase [Mesorhizobium marinum]|uniref:class I SAM-dependent methyltransferase n=1 Tax=Mesorhizobium marinum TaxID=3228790 RepID=UPI003467B458
MPLVIDAVCPASVVDVGCGVGTWSAAFLSRSIEATGVDGAYVRTEDLQIPADRFQTIDLDKPPPARSIGSFDLAICMEVAEHLKPANAEGLVAFLTDLAPNVLFSAAIPGQGGRGHINERWQSYWVSLFTRRKMHCHDIIRPAIWSSPGVRRWYAQNAFLFTREPRADLAASSLPLDLVHPQIFHNKHRNDRIRRASRRGTLIDGAG